MSTTAIGRQSPLSGIVITGASSDIGGVLTDHFARKRMPLILTTRSGSVKLREESKNIHVLSSIDLAHRDALETLAKSAAKSFDAPFGLIHCVGDFWEHKAISSCPPEEARELIVSHYLTLYGTLHHLLPIMLARGGGRVVAFSCTSVGFNYPEMAAFSSAKAAVECLIRCTANEWSQFGIIANSIALSTIATAKVLKSKPLAKEESYVTPEELCSLVDDVLFSSSPYLSGNVIRPLKHSNTYYNKAYFDRNPQTYNHLRPSSADAG